MISLVVWLALTLPPPPRARPVDPAVRWMLCLKEKRRLRRGECVWWR